MVSLIRNRDKKVLYCILRWLSSSIVLYSIISPLLYFVSCQSPIRTRYCFIILRKLEIFYCVVNKIYLFIYFLSAVHGKNGIGFISQKSIISKSTGLFLNCSTWIHNWKVGGGRARWIRMTQHFSNQLYLIGSGAQCSAPEHWV